LPARFRRERVLIVGCGDVGVRVARELAPRVRLLALTSSAARVPELRALGLTPLAGDMDKPASLKRLSGLASRVVHLAPPPGLGRHDPRTKALLATLRRRSTVQSLVYGSTSGVYGDCQGDLVTESRAPNPETVRAQRRIDAEDRVRHFGRATGTCVTVLRIPGIYAPDRVGGTPRERLLKGTPVLQQTDDVFTNHIHADDLARACVAAMWRGRAGRSYNVNDDSQLKMGDYFDLAANLYGLPKPPRLPRALAQEQLPVMQLSFMSESRRMDNTRMKSELRLKLRYPSVIDGLAAIPRQGRDA
jgi:nucleoside-diphosphate-sugar epimerase